MILGKFRCVSIYFTKFNEYLCSEIDYPLLWTFPYKFCIFSIFSVISGHQDFNSLYAANDTEQQSFTVNTLGAPNNSTTVVSI